MFKEEVGRKVVRPKPAEPRCDGRGAIFAVTAGLGGFLLQTREVGAEEVSSFLLQTLEVGAEEVSSFLLQVREVGAEEVRTTHNNIPDIQMIMNNNHRPLGGPTADISPHDHTFREGVVTHGGISCMRSICCHK